MIPERVLPAPLPKIEPQWEYAVDEALVRTYEDYKHQLQVPWVGVVSMAYARYRPFFDCWWAGMREVVDTQAYVDLAYDMRALVESWIADLDPPPIVPRLLNQGYSAREIDNIRDIIEFLSHGNFVQIPAVFLARLLLEGGHFGSDSISAQKVQGRHAVNCETPFVLLEPHHVLPDMADVYRDVMDRVGLPFVNTDYRALARWPTYFAMAWSDLRTHVGGAVHEDQARKMHNAIFDAIGNLPNPAGLDARQLINAAGQDGAFDQILDTTRVFTHLIPALTVNVAFFRHQLL